MRNSLKITFLSLLMFIGMSSSVSAQTIPAENKFDPLALFKASVDVTGVVISQKSHLFLGGQCTQSHGENIPLPDLFVFETSSSQYPNAIEIKNCLNILEKMKFRTVTIPANGTNPDSIKEARMKDLSCMIIEVSNTPKIFSVYFSNRDIRNMSNEIMSCFKRAELSQNQVRVKWEKVAQ